MIYYAHQTADYTEIHEPVLYKTLDEAQATLNRNFYEMITKLGMMRSVMGCDCASYDEFYNHFLHSGKMLYLFNSPDHNYCVTDDSFWIDGIEPDDEDYPEIYIHMEKISPIEV